MQLSTKLGDGAPRDPLPSRRESSKLAIFLISLTVEMAQILRGDPKRTTVTTYMKRIERVKTWRRRR
jgi:hypothetical protein